MARKKTKSLRQMYPSAMYLFNLLYRKCFMARESTVQTFPASATIRPLVDILLQLKKDAPCLQFRKKFNHLCYGAAACIARCISFLFERWYIYYMKLSTACRRDRILLQCLLIISFPLFRRFKPILDAFGARSKKGRCLT